MRKSAFLLSLVFILIVPWEGVIELPGLGTGTEVLGFLLAAFWLASVLFTNNFRKPHPFHLVVLLFVLWNALSIFWSTDPRRTLDQIMTWALLVILIFIIWDLYTTRAAMMAGLQAYIFGAFVSIGNAISNFFNQNAYYSHYERFSPGDLNPDGFGFIVALGVPVAWYLASSENTTKIGGILRLLNYAYIPAAFIGLALSGTRTAMIATIPGIIFGLATLTRLRIWARIAIFILLTSGIFLLLPVVQPLRSFQRFGTTADALSSGDLNQRTYLWREGMEAFVENPILGVGSNMFRSINGLGKVAHNTYISVLVELGLVGFALFGIVLMIVFNQAWRQHNWERRFWLSILLVWAIGASTLTWEFRKTTWLFFSLALTSATLTHLHNKEISAQVRPVGSR
ncbi:MAG: O-antigen ligase family protein [Reinekea sp.]|nr:O-antigen ligase family protein [Reinekea sp.]